MGTFKELVNTALRPKPSIVEFAESSDYCNRPLFPYQKVLLKLIFLEEMTGREEDILTTWIKGERDIILSPEIRKRIEICRERGYDHFNEIEMVGGRRSSKGYVTGLAGAYKLYDVHQLGNPGEYFGMDLEKVIDFSCIAAAENQAITRQFADFRSSILACKPLKPYISKDLETVMTIKTDSDDETMKRMRADGIKVTRDFAKLRVTPLAANADTVRGSASIFLVFDEMAFFLPGESRSSAVKCYEAAEPSLAQFGYHAMIFCNSSPATEIGQFYDQWELAMRPSNHPEDWYPMRFAIQFPTWALYQEWWTDEHRRFKHPIMPSPDWPDQLVPEMPESSLDSFALDQREKERLLEKANPDTYKVERRGQWATVLDAYLDPIKVDLAFSGVLPDGRLCRMTSGGSYEMGEYKGHCDPSSTTAGFGFAIAHVETFPDPTGIFPDGIARHVVFDKIMRWNPQDFPGGTINYILVRQDLEKYIKTYYPTVLTFDQYNSVGLIQELREFAHNQNIWNCRIGVVNATSALNWNRWEAFKTALYLGLVHFPPDCIDPKTEFDHSEYTKMELKFLQEVSTGQSKRVDKQDMGPIQTKDIADCCAEVVVKFLGSYLGDFADKSLGKAHLETGAEGGYQIGGRMPGGPMGGFAPENKQGRFDPGDWWNRGGYNDPQSARGISGRRRRG